MAAYRGYLQRWGAAGCRLRVAGCGLRVAVCIAVTLAACATEGVTPPDVEKLAVGTWGGDNVGILVSDTTAHVHIGCTNGYFRGPIRLTQFRFEAQGYYYPRVHPVAVGPAVPARIMGSVTGNVVNFTVIVDDTVEKKTTTLGPNSATFGKDPRMGPCPICENPKR